MRHYDTIKARCLEHFYGGNNAISYRVAWLLGAILLVSFFLRMYIIFSGGQYFWPDETYRYQVSIQTAQGLWTGDFGAALRIFERSDHFLFMLLGVIPASLEMFWGENPKIPAIFFSFFSLANLLLMWAILRRLGKDQGTAIIGTGLLALCSTFFYYSRHLLPYDTAMAFALFSLFLGLRKPLRDIDSILCGFFAGLAFMLHYGHWVIVSFVMLVHVFQPPLELKKCFRRAVLSGISLVTPFVSIAIVASIIGAGFLQHFFEFSGSPFLGVYSEGWKVPFVFFWYAERGFTLLWAVFLIYGLKKIFSGKSKKPIVIGAAGIFYVYTVLLIFSVVLEKHAVYGRLSRQIVPFFVILGALFIGELWSIGGKGRIAVRTILIFSVLQAGLNFYGPLTQVFPREFRQMTDQISTPPEEGKYERLFASFMDLRHPQPDFLREGGISLLTEKHPMQFLPYQYEGYTPEQREKLRSSDISMRLVFRPYSSYVVLGVSALQRGDVRSGVSHFREAIADDPTDHDAYLLLSQVYMRMGEHDRAIELLDKATSFVDDQGEIYYLLSVLYKLSGEKELAIKNAEKAFFIFREKLEQENLKKTYFMIRELRGIS